MYLKQGREILFPTLLCTYLAQPYSAPLYRYALIEIKESTFSFEPLLKKGHETCRQKHNLPVFKNRFWGYSQMSEGNREMTAMFWHTFEARNLAIASYPLLSA